MYLQYVESVNNLSNSVGILVGNYENFLSGLYPYYYEKSDCQYCYQKYDSTGYYNHDWFIDHEEKYNAVYIRDRLNECYNFSLNNENIHNYPILDTIGYLSGEFNTLSGNLVMNVINGIKDFGYNDIHALTIEGEMDDAYDWLKDKIDQRYEFLKNLVEGLKIQANALLDTYNSTNNAFTQAVANYDDGNEVYSLTGNTAIYCCSTNNPPTKGAKEAYEFSRCTRSNKAPSSGYLWMAADVVNGTAYYWVHNSKDDSGSAVYIEQGSPGYSADGTLEQRCQSVRKYMNTPTSFMFLRVDPESDDWLEQFNYGLMNDGMQASLDSATASIQDMWTTSQSVKRQLEEIGFTYDGEANVDILSEINSLIEFVNSKVDETWYEKDKYIKDYRSFQEEIISLSAQYLPVKEVYDSINTTYEYSAYLGQFVFDTSFTMGSIQKINKYVNKTDDQNRRDIKARINEFISQYDELQVQYLSVAEDLARNEYTYRRIERV